MRFRNTLAIAMLTLAASVSLTGCGSGDEPLTDAQMQRKLQEQQLMANQQKLDIEKAQARADLDAQRLQNQALTQQMLPPQQVQQAQQYGAAPPPAQQADQGIGTGTAILGAAAVGTAGYLMGRSNSNNTYSDRSRPTTTTTRVIQQPPTRVYQAAPRPAYQAPSSSATRSAPARSTGGYTRLSSTKRR